MAFLIWNCHEAVSTESNQVDHLSWASLLFSLGIQPKVRWQEMRQPRVIAPSLSASTPGTSDVCVLCDHRQSESFNELRLHNFPGRPAGRRGFLYFSCSGVGRSLAWLLP